MTAPPKKEISKKKKKSISGPIMNTWIALNPIMIKIAIKVSRLRLG